jgi:hypothetical protein
MEETSTTGRRQILFRMAMMKIMLHEERKTWGLWRYGVGREGHEYLRCFKILGYERHEAALAALSLSAHSSQLCRDPKVGSAKIVAQSTVTEIQNPPRDQS